MDAFFRVSQTVRPTKMKCQVHGGRASSASTASCLCPVLSSEHPEAAHAPAVGSHRRLTTPRTIRACRRPTYNRATGRGRPAAATELVVVRDPSAGPEAMWLKAARAQRQVRTLRPACWGSACMHAIPSQHTPAPRPGATPQCTQAAPLLVGACCHWFPTAGDIAAHACRQALRACRTAVCAV